MPEVWRNAALESIKAIHEALDGGNIVFVSACTGSGTRIGVAPIIARVAMELGELTIGFTTMPFGFEGSSRKNVAEVGLEEFKKCVDFLLGRPQLFIAKICQSFVSRLSLPDLCRKDQ